MRTEYWIRTVETRGRSADFRPFGNTVKHVMRLPWSE